MKIDAGLMGALEAVPERARELEAQGFDGLVTAEMSSDPFFPLTPKSCPNCSIRSLVVMRILEILAPSGVCSWKLAINFTVRGP